MEWLDCQNIDYIKDGSEILSRINLKIKEGEIVTILGPNGSGKSTLIKLISRSIYPRIKSGSKFKIYGKEMINIWDMRSKISFMNNEIHQRTHGSLKVKDIVLSGIYGSIGIPKNINPSKINYDQAIKLIEKFNLSNKVNSRYDQLSDGQKRIVQILRALINKPKVLILDEPTSNLDINSTYLLINFLSSVIKEDISLLMSTNSIDNILKETTRVILIKEGIIKADGLPYKTINSEELSLLYDIEIKVLNSNGYWRAVPMNKN